MTKRQNFSLLLAVKCLASCEGPMQTLLRYVILLNSILFGLTACQVLQQHLKEPQIAFQSVAFQPISLQEGRLDSTVKITNPNAFKLPVRSMLYRLTLNEREFASNTLSLDESIPANGSVQVKLPITLKYAELIGGVTNALQNKRIRFQLTGEMDFGLLTVPYSKTGEFNLSY